MKYITIILVALIACSPDDPKPITDITGNWTFSVPNLSANFTIFKSGNDFYVKKGSKFSIDGKNYTTGQDDIIQGVGLFFRTDVSQAIATGYNNVSYIQFPAIPSSDFKTMDGSNVSIRIWDSPTDIQEKTYTEHFIISRR